MCAEYVLGEPREKFQYVYEQTVKHAVGASSRFLRFPILGCGGASPVSTPRLLISAGTERMDGRFSRARHWPASAVLGLTLVRNRRQGAARLHRPLRSRGRAGPARRADAAGLFGVGRGDRGRHGLEGVFRIGHGRGGGAGSRTMPSATSIPEEPRLPSRGVYEETRALLLGLVRDARVRKSGAGSAMSRGARRPSRRQLASSSWHCKAPRRGVR